VGGGGGKKHVVIKVGCIRDRKLKMKKTIPLPEIKPIVYRSDQESSIYWSQWTTGYFLSIYSNENADLNGFFTCISFWQLGVAVLVPNKHSPISKVLCGLVRLMRILTTMHVNTTFLQ
jgi:hypothetical protein